MSELRRDAQPLTRLFFFSFAGLYTELMLIRWIGTEVRVFAYVQNLALVASFLGFGLGCYRSARPTSLVRSAASLAGLVFVVEFPSERWRVLLANVSNLLTLSPDAALWGSPWLEGSSIPVALLTASAVCVTTSMLMLVVFAMIPFGQMVGKCLDECANLEIAYSANLLGSLVGTWAIAVLAFLWLSPAWWFAFAFVMAAALQSGRMKKAVTIALLIPTLVLLRPDNGAQTTWSPYQKLRIYAKGEQQYQIDVNNTGYMSISNLSPDYLARHPQLSTAYRDLSYDSPYRFLSNKDSVLIVGAGAGNDVAAALRSGVKRIDAVEIDPAIYELGRRLHPEKPYSAPNVRVILDDARSFVRSTPMRYDAIVFGLLDSHTQFSGYTNMRIDNYVYTKEAFQEARRLLAPDGVLVLKFEVREPWTWMGRRFQAMLNDVFGRMPITYHCEQMRAVFPATVFLESNSDTLLRRSQTPELQDFLARHPANFSVQAVPTPATTDDWPYVYHADHSIPRTYLTVAVILLLLSLFFVRRDVNPRSGSSWKFFFLGAGFLLIETQLVSRLALYFGSTWIVNCIAITIVLVVLVLASLLVWVKPRINIAPWYLLLLAGLVLVTLLPVDYFGLSVRVTGWMLGLLYAIPVFAAGVVFTTSLRDEVRKSEALGANLVGAVVGGVLQSLSFIFGLRALLLVAAILYLLSAAFSRASRPKPQKARAAAAELTSA